MEGCLKDWVILLKYLLKHKFKKSILSSIFYLILTKIPSLFPYKNHEMKIDIFSKMGHF